MVEIARRIYANVNDADSDNKTVISVGSGLGVIEGFIKYISGLKNKIVCIDPAPTSWQKASNKTSVTGSMYTPPSHKTVKHMLSSGNYHGCNTLLIIWSSPNQGSENFDLSAITDLNPDNIIIWVEMLGGAGSTKMLRQLSLIDGIYTGLEKEILDTLTESESYVDDGESSLQDYYLTDLIKGNNGKERTLPTNFSTMDPTQKYITALAYANLTFLYSVIVLSKKPRKPTIKIDPREFKRCEAGNNVLNAYFEKMWETVSGQSK
jgi:hypothetical protein